MTYIKGVAREPDCVHSLPGQLQPASACRICKDGPDLAEWKAWWATHPDLMPKCSHHKAWGECAVYGCPCSDDSKQAVRELTLTEFLYARFAEDEFAAQEADWAMQGKWYAEADDKVDEYVKRFAPARVLAECEAKKEVVKFHDSWPTLVETPIETETTSDIDGYVLRASKQIAWLTTREYVARFGTEPPTAPILAFLALPYADHEDYRPEWKP